MKKLLILYMLLLFTACTENGALHHGRKTVDDSYVIDAGTQKQAVSGPGLAISVIVNREIALHETTISIEEELGGRTTTNRIASELP
ncbi:hypothetical protein [Prolixibacter denitrificans]|uniref:Uncharacterized protein n=1 Tax=Prolixibacter denitrificans TaxID=1541063 RepID=A0A2P8C7L3_9BACT|nr:hypothetical protein [Prolixibacter denitrificans]PSK80952.1 hypothetical protein CLV93_11287 [Prolixibacter denitrificans]GET22352.1 hypothetical protein JCM18694_25980 [Prolixibacter denitrificans]